MLKSDELKQELENLKAQAKELTVKEDAKAEEINAKADEIKALKAKIAIQEQIEADEKVEMENKIKNEKAKLIDGKEDIDNMENKNKDLGLIVAKAIIGKATTEELAEIKDLMTEGDRNKGGVTVPSDVQTKIIELQRNKFDIRPYLNVEPVGTMKGSRPIEANEPQAQGFASVDEGADIQALYEPEFTELEYNVRKYAGYIPLTNELLADTTENILGFITKWMAKNELNTYAYQAFNGTGVKSAKGIMTEATKVDGLLKNRIEKVDTPPVIKKFKTIINVDLEDIASDNIVIFTNADGYDYLDGLEDKNGKPYMQPDPTKASGYTFLGKEIVKVPKKFLANIDDAGTIRTPFVIGDLKLLYTMFDRKQMSIESTNIGGTAWRQDKTEVKGIFRFDGEFVDTKAVKILLAKLV